MDRKSRKEKGEGVGILIPKNIERCVIENNSVEDHERLETKWIKLECRQQNRSIFVFYGPQKHEKAETTIYIYIYINLEIQMTKLADNEMKLDGDFNATLNLETQTKNKNNQEMKKILQELINKNDLNRDMDKTRM